MLCGCVWTGIQAIDADEYAHKVRSILEKEYATHPSDQMNSLLQKAILAETAASMAVRTLPLALLHCPCPLSIVPVLHCLALPSPVLVKKKTTACVPGLRSRI